MDRILLLDHNLCRQMLLANTLYHENRHTLFLCRLTTFMSSPKNTRHCFPYPYTSMLVIGINLLFTYVVYLPTSPLPHLFLSSLSLSCSYLPRIVLFLTCVLNQILHPWLPAHNSWFSACDSDPLVLLCS